MNVANEVLLSTDGSGQLWNGCIWDYTTGTSLRVLKGGTTAKRTLALIGRNRVISADIVRPVLTCWSLNTKEQTQLRIVCPGRVTALTVSPDGVYCVGAVAEKLYIWQVSTGDLLTVISQHFLTVTCLRISDDGGFIISAGEDCLVLVWKLARILRSIMGSATNDSQNDTPDYRWANHSLAVTDIHVGKGGRRARVLTSSLDRTCSLYSLANGEHLLTVLFEVSIHAVCMDASEAFIFAGGTNGTTFQVNIFDPPQTLEHHYESSKDKEFVFQGHSGQITCLAVSMDSLTLVSGSSDCSVKIWSIPSRQCLRSLLHKGPVTNLVFFMEMYTSHTSAKHTQHIQAFRSFLCGADDLDGKWTHTACVIPPTRTSNAEDLFEVAKNLYNRSDKNQSELQTEVDVLKDLNGQLLYRLTNASLNPTEH